MSKKILKKNKEFPLQNVKKANHGDSSGTFWTTIYVGLKASKIHVCTFYLCGGFLELDCHFRIVNSTDF
jgi:hypothetical protein